MTENTQKFVDFLKKANGADVNHLAWFIATSIENGWCPRFEQHGRMTTVGWRSTLRLFIRRVLWELREYGHLQTHPEDTLRRAVSNCREYEYRGYHIDLNDVCFAFARQFVDDFSTLSHVNWRYSLDMWLIEVDGSARKRYGSRCFSVCSIRDKSAGLANSPNVKQYAVCEEWDTWNEGWRKEKVLTFDTAAEAQFFIAQLVELLNTSEEENCICQEATQLIRDTLTQAPIEEFRRQKEYEEQRRAEEAERLRKQREREESKRTKAERHQRRMEQLAASGARVYIFEFENNTCKIGWSTNIKNRAATVHGHSGLDIQRWCCTNPRGDAPNIEKKCHKHFDDYRRYNTEFFNISYEEARDYLKTLVPIEQELEA